MTDAAIFSPALRLHRKRDPLPGLPLTLGFTVFYLSALVLVPLAGLILRATGIGWHGFFAIATSPRVLAAFETSFGIAFLAAFADCFIGLLIAWVLVRYRFPLHRVFDALVDLPIALPTAVAGITLTQLYDSQSGWLGAPLFALGINVDYTKVGIFVALAFIGLPFVVRTLEPVLRDLEKDVEEAAATLGASPWQIFTRIILPPMLPAILTGFTLAFGRGVGEYGSVIFIVGTAQATEIVPVLIVAKLTEYDYAGAAVIGALMLVYAFLIMLAVNALQGWSRKRLGH
jgi:sulfate transport system permease protein